MTLDEIAKLVGDELSQRTGELGAYTFVVHKTMSFQDEEQLWHVYVEPNQTIPKRGQFYDILNDIEQELETSYRENVMLVPVKPEKATAAPGG